MEVSEEQDEQLDPAARRYFVYGAPAYITQNLNSAATGLVNGSKGYLHSLTWSDADAEAERLPPRGRTGELVEVPVPLAVNIFIPGLTDEDEMDSVSQDFADRLVPVFAVATNTKKRDAVLARPRHSYDLGFCITYHKVQGQTLDEVVLVLHHRKARQLLSLCFEMLYVGLTRVRRTADIRILYFEEDERELPPRKKRKRGRCKSQIKHGINPGLQHLLNLKRPIHFDAWLAGYNKAGRWDDAALRAQAANDRDTALKTLSQPVKLTHATYTVAKLKGLAKALGLDVPNAPGKQYSNKEQYLSVIFPEWVRLGDKREIPQRYCVGQQKSGDDSEYKESGDNDLADKESADKNAEKRSGKHKYNGTQEETGSDSAENNKPEAALDCIAAPQLRTIRDAMSQLRSRRSQLSRRELRTRVYSQKLPQIGRVSEYNAAGLLEGYMMCDSILYSGAQMLCEGSRVHAVDPLAVRHEKLLLKSGSLARERGIRVRNCRDANILCKLQSGYTLALPYNEPENVHWIPVFAWLNNHGELCVCHGNSHAGYQSSAIEAVSSAKRLLQRLYDNAEYRPRNMTPFVCKTMECTVPWQPSGSLACGEHTLAAIALAARGLLLSHTFSLAFVSRIRERVMDHLLRHKIRGRRTSHMPEQDDADAMMRRKLRFTIDLT